MLPLSEAPIVSVVIPAFNAARFIGDAIDSVAASTYRAWQCIVVDDGSTDHTADVVEGHAARDRRVELIRKTNAGPLSCFSVAADRVHGDVVCFLDADDLFVPHKLASVVAGLRESPGAGFLVHRLAVCDSGLRMVGVTPTRRRLPEGDLSEQVLRTRRGVVGLGVSSAFCFRAEIYRALFPAGFTTRRYPDEYVRRSAPLITEVRALDRILGLRRLHGGNLTGAGRSFAETVRRARHDYARLADALTAFAERHGHGDRLAPDGADLDLLYLDWIAARLDGDRGSQAAWQRLVGSPGYSSQPRPMRAWWWLAHRVPRPAFPPFMAALSRSDRLRVLANFAASITRPPRAECLPRRAPLRAVVRMAAGWST